MKKMLLTGLTMTAALALCGGARAAAVDLGALSTDTTYEVPEFAEVSATFTPEASGPAKFVYYNSCSPFDVYTSADYSDSSQLHGSYSTTGNNNIYTYDLTAGTTYYLHIGFVMQGGSFAIETGASTLTMIGALPELAEGAKFSVGDYSTMSVRFSSPVNVGGALLRGGGQSVAVTPEVHQGTFVDVVVAGKLMQLYRSGAISDGSDVTLVLNDVTDAVSGDKFDGKGVVEVTFPMAGKPAEVVKKNFYFTGEGTNTLDSYYFPGDERAQAVIEFDMPLNADFDTDPTGSALEIEIAKGYIPTAQFKYGNVEDVDLTVYQEEIYGTVAGNTVTFDLSGVRRRKLDMLPGATDDQLEDQLGIYFKNMRSADGQRVYTGSTTNFAGFWATYAINEINCYISSEFTPFEGSELKYGETMEIWVGNGAGIRFDGVEFGFTKDNEAQSLLVPFADIDAQVDPDDADSRIYTFAIPQLDADPGTAVEVSLKNMLSADGFDHSADVAASFKAPELSGLEAAVSDAGSADVYDVGGRCVIRGANASQLGTLESGVYIIDGKKYRL